VLTQLNSLFTPEPPSQGVQTKPLPSTIDEILNIGKLIYSFYTRP